MRRALRKVLPITVGAVSIPLIIWDIHNERMIASMGMAWDLGAPVWPYQTPDIVLRILSFPAYIFAMPIANWLNLWAHVGASYLVTGPLILGWWWLLGFWLDRGLVKRSKRKSWLPFLSLILIAFALSWAAASGLQDSFHWWSRYGRFRSLASFLTMMRLVTPAIWSAITAILIGLAAKNMAAPMPTERL